MQPKDPSLDFLLELRLQVSQPAITGATPLGERRIATITGGTFAGPRLNGTVHANGGDWILAHPDGSVVLDVRCLLETDDGARIYMTYRGYRHGPADVIARVNRGEKVDPASFYFRTAPFFETGHEKYLWLNTLVTVGSGYRTPEGPIYRVFSVL